MGKQAKNALRRKIAQADLHMDESLLRIMEVYEVFNPVHPHLAVVLDQAAQALMLSQDLLKVFWKESWGASVVNMDSYLSQRSRKHG